MARLPRVGDDNGTWGQILNDYLSQSHTDNGALRPSIVQTTHLENGAVTRDKLAPRSVTPDKLTGIGDPGGLATLNASGRLPTDQLPTHLSEPGLDETIALRSPVRAVAGAQGDVTARQVREGLGLMADPIDFGAVGDGTANDSAALQAAVSWLETNGGGSLVIPRGRRFAIPDGLFLVRNATVPISLIGQGGVLSKGTVTVGPATPTASGVAVHGMRISGVTFDGEDAYGSRVLLSIGGVRGLTITDECVFQRAGIGIGTYGDSTSGEAFHSLAMLRINKCRFGELMFALKHAATRWDYASDWDITDCFVNYAADTSFWIASDDGSQGGVDGLNFQGNVMFHMGNGSYSNPLWAQKRNNLRVGKTDWIRIINNNFFQAGTEAVYLRDLRDFVYVGNHIAWSGARERTAMLRIEQSPSLRGVVSDSTFSLWSGNAIGVYDSPLGDLEIGQNEYRFDPYAGQYIGPANTHRVSIIGNPTGGVYRLNVNGTSTSNLTPTSDATAIANALNAISGSNTAVVANVSAGVYTVTFTEEATLRSAWNFTGGTSPSISIVTMIDGNASPRIFANSGCSGYPNIRSFHYSNGPIDSIRGSAMQTRDARTTIQGIASATTTTAVAGSYRRIFNIADILNVGARAGGLIQITARRQQAADTLVAHYLLFVSTEGNVCTVVSSGGRTTGATADEPSFTWTLAGAELRASRVGSVDPTATFVFEAVSLGALQLK